MKVLLINPPYQTFTSNIGVGHQVPLGLLSIGGPLLDSGREVTLLDAECLKLTNCEIVTRVAQIEPDIVMTGHAGSTPAHICICGMLRAIKAAYPAIITVYGGVYPTYHPVKILAEAPYVDIVVCGEGEATSVDLVDALQKGRNLASVPGIAYRGITGYPVLTKPRAPIENLDDYRVGWELIDDWDRYRCGGVGHAAIIQFSRGCPHRCTYCGQHGFWVNWRHRNPHRVIDEIEWLHKTHGVNFCTIADENPTTLKAVWKQLLEELAARKLPVKFFATIRATDIVRDADILPLYRAAGIVYVLMGIETTDPKTIKRIHKGSSVGVDERACKLLRQNGILSVLGHVVGLADETVGSLFRSQKRLAEYDGDFLNAMYVTPHSWTVFGREMESTAVVQTDRSKWDYRHQILAQDRLKPWQLFVMVKWLEICFHLSPRKLWRIVADPDPVLRQQRRWTLFRTSGVFFAEIWEFFCRLKFETAAQPLKTAPRLSRGAFGRPVTASTASISGAPSSRTPHVPIRAPQIGHKGTRAIPLVMADAERTTNR